MKRTQQALSGGHSISMKLKMAMLLFVIIAFGFSFGIFYIYLGTADKLTTENERLLVHELENKRDVIGESLQGRENNVISLLYDRSLRAQLLSETARLDTADLYNTLYAYCDRFCNTLPGMVGLAIYKTNGTCFRYLKSYSYDSRSAVSDTFFDDYESYLQYCQAKGIDLVRTCVTPSWFGPDETPQPLKKERCFSNVYLLRGEQSGHPVGFLSVFFSEASLQNLYSYGNGASFLLSSDGVVLSATADDIQTGTTVNDDLLKMVTEKRTIPSVFSVPIDGTNAKAASVYLPDFSMYLVVLPVFNVLDTMQNALLLSVIVLLIAAICYSAASAVFFSSWITKPISRLKATVEQARSGDLNARYAITTKDEIGFLGNSFNLLLDTIQALMQNERKLEQEQRFREIRFLHGQINPHLLYNTLDSVLYFISHGELETANRVIEDCSSFFRLSLSRGNACVPLKQELEHVSYYIDLQRLCRQKLITLTVTGEESVQNQDILRLTLQPIVENCFLHAFEGVTQNGEIHIDVSEMDNGGMCIQIEDNGIGMEEDELDALQHRLASPSIPQNHFGLWNTNKRLQTFYGPESGLQVESLFGEYTRVRVYIWTKGGFHDTTENNDC